MDHRAVAALFILIVFFAFLSVWSTGTGGIKHIELFSVPNIFHIPSFVSRVFPHQLFTLPLGGAQHAIQHTPPPVQSVLPQN